MRQLFVPACLCLMTFSASSAGDPKLPLEQLGRPILEMPSVALKSSSAHDSRVTEDAIFQDAAVVLAIPSDRPIAIPTQTKLAPVLEPQPAPLPPTPKPVVHRSRQEMCDAVVQAAHKNDLPIPYFIRLLFQESGFKPDVVSHAGAQGVAQFMPETAASVGLHNPFDPLEAIPASARLLRSLFQQFGNLGLAAAAYNAGPKRIMAWLAKKGKLPQETQGYVKSITGRPAENWKVAEAGTPEMKLPRHAPCQDAAGLLAWNGPEHIPMPLPSPRTRVASTTDTPRPEVKHSGHVALLAKTENRPARQAAKKITQVAVQFAARKGASKAKRDAKPEHTVRPPAKPLRLAVATRK